MNSSGPISPRAISRSARNGEINDTIVIRPASTNSFATSATRRIFSTRSASVKPRSRLSPWRTLSPSSTNVRLPSAWSFCSKLLAIVDLPAPERPVNHSSTGLCPFSRARGLGDFEGLGIGVCGAAQREADHAGADSSVAVAIDQNEAASDSILFIGSKADRLDGCDVDEGDFVAMQLLFRQMLQRSSIEPVLKLGDHCANRLPTR